MSLPYHRGQVTTNMNNRTGAGWGTRDQRVEEANRTLMEQENDRKWVSNKQHLFVSYPIAPS